MDTNKRLTRSGKGMIAGVCEGIADYAGLDPTPWYVVVKKQVKSL